MTIKLCMICLIFLLINLTTGQSNIFQKVINSPIVNDPTNSFGCSWADYDDDGLLDLFVANSHGLNNFLYHNKGGGVFEKITTGIVVNSDGASFSSTWGDVDGDEDIDLYVANGANLSGAKNFLFLNDGAGAFTMVSSGIIVEDVRPSNAASWVDYDNDGDLDLFVVSYLNENNNLYRNDGDLQFTKITTGSIVNDGGLSLNCSWSDINNDGLTDVFVTNNRGQNNFLYLNKGVGSFEKVMDDPVVTDGGTSVGSSWGDYDNDGYQDLFVANIGYNFLYHNKGDGTFERVLNNPIVNDVANSYGGEWADYDNDGYLDLFVANRDKQNNFLYNNNGDGTFSKITTDIITNDGGRSETCCWGDYDNDGDLDIFVTNERGQVNFLYENLGNNNSWINIRCIGTVSNSSGIGSRVRLKSKINGKEVWQLREISGQTGYISQSSLNAEFGIGDATNIDVIIIEWSSGLFTELTDVAVNQFLTIREIPLPPNIIAINAPIDPVEVNKEIQVTGEFVDPNDQCTHTALWDWGDGTITSGVVTQSNGSGIVSGIHNYESPGIYTLKLTVTNNFNISSTSNYEFIVIYDPSAGFITGGGWINSPAGAYEADPSLTGKANFGFVAKYKKGQSIPSGNTEFRFHAADFNFHSTIYDWLVIAGRKAKFRGCGTINGEGEYNFTVTATDAKLIDDTDLFRIKIKGENGIIYDNQIGDEDDADASYEIEGGNIVIHNGNLSKPLKDGLFKIGESSITTNSYLLMQNYPNPFNPNTLIEFNIAEYEYVALKVYNIKGQEITTILSQNLEAGLYKYEYDGSNLTSGVYYYQIVTGEYRQVRKMILLR